jgi:predicted transcriptional regulator
MDKTPELHAFRLGERGLARVLGSMEAAIMEVAWASPAPLRIAEVRQALAHRGRTLSFNAVMTVMNNLVAKGLLERYREPGSRAHRYRPLVEREAFLAGAARQVARGLVRDFGELAVSQFLDVLREEDPQALGRLRELLGQGGQGSHAPQ